MTGTPEHNVWMNMLQRCVSPSYKLYPYYGGRGITVCDRWRTDFTAFYADMGPRPSKKHSLERLDNDGPYAVGNVVWGTRVMQMRNRRTTVFLTFNGVRRPMAEWAELVGLTYGALKCRVFRSRWTIERALTEPAHAIGSARRAP